MPAATRHGSDLNADVGAVADAKLYRFARYQVAPFGVCPMVRCFLNFSNSPQRLTCPAKKVERGIEDIKVFFRQIQLQPWQKVQADPPRLARPDSAAKALPQDIVSAKRTPQPEMMDDF